MKQSRFLKRIFFIIICGVSSIDQIRNEDIHIMTSTNKTEKEQEM